MTKHTQGPWTADKLEDRATFNIFASGFASAMCQVSVMENSTRRTAPAEVAANAALIAAAPELLEALKDAYPFVSNANLRAQIGNLIAKAEGTA